jgi:CRP/FNR family cyclic AMP-dependent transcriptional regulator
MKALRRGATKDLGTVSRDSSGSAKTLSAAGDQTNRSKISVFDVKGLFDSHGVARKRRVFQKGEIIFHQSDLFEHALLIEDGSVKLSALSHGGKVAAVGLFGSGEFLGLACLAGERRCRATATAILRTSVRYIPKRELLGLLREDRAFFNYFMLLLLQTNLRMEQALVNLLFGSTEQRLIWTLFSLAQRSAQSGEHEVTLPRMSQTLLAEMVGSTRTQVNGFMNRLRRLSLINYNKGGITVRQSPLMEYLKGASQQHGELACSE